MLSAYYNRGIICKKQGKNDLAKIDLENAKRLFQAQSDLANVEKVNSALQKFFEK